MGIEQDNIHQVFFFSNGITWFRYLKLLRQQRSCLPKSEMVIFSLHPMSITTHQAGFAQRQRTPRKTKSGRMGDSRCDNDNWNDCPIIHCIGDNRFSMVSVLVTKTEPYLLTRSKSKQHFLSCPIKFYYCQRANATRKYPLKGNWIDSKLISLT